MKLKYYSLLGTMLIVSILLSSCAKRLIDFTIISSKNVSLNVNKDSPRVIGKAMSIKGAVDKAIESAGTGYDALIDGVVYKRGFIGFKVEGTPIKTKK